MNDWAIVKLHYIDYKDADNFQIYVCEDSIWESTFPTYVPYHNDCKLIYDSGSVCLMSDIYIYIHTQIYIENNIKFPLTALLHTVIYFQWIPSVDKMDTIYLKTYFI